MNIYIFIFLMFLMFLINIVQSPISFRNWYMNNQMKKCQRKKISLKQFSLETLYYGFWVSFIMNTNSILSTNKNYLCMYIFICTFKRGDIVSIYTWLIVGLYGKELLSSNLPYSHHLQKTQQSSIYHLGVETKQNNLSKLIIENQTSRSENVPDHSSAHLTIRFLTSLLQPQQNI